ncbi:NADP-dependent oxidoreductase [Mycolicibacterium aichiense]|nr:NADP-dependent oxidoreductase [Mycolicibacterium aichiense]MCV7020708.1 NADP-dependent oxidoreductase [Mycolicibacterium aichiense]
MTALRAHRRGGPEVLVVERAPIPVPAAGEVLVEVHAAAITFDELTWDETWQRNGADRTPTIPSHEVSGVVVGTTDEVYGLIPFDRDGAAAEYVAVPSSCLATRPATCSHLAAAALPLAGLTAWQALVEHADVQPGERVLVHGGAGGVGGLVIQLAARMGADVTTTVRSDVTGLMRELGATTVIDTRADAFDAPGAVYDVVVDTVGGQTMERSFGVLRPGGRLVTLAAPPPPGKAEEFDVDATFFIVTPDRAQLAELAALVDAGGMQIAIAETFPLRDGRAAFESGARPHRRPGKTVLIVRD